MKFFDQVTVAFLAASRLLSRTVLAKRTKAVEGGCILNPNPKYVEIYGCINQKLNMYEHV